MMDVLFAGPRMTAVRARLEELRRLPAPDGFAGLQADSAARRALEVACQAAFTAGVELAAMRGAVDFWADATGGPRVTINAWSIGAGGGGQPSEDVLAYMEPAAQKSAEGGTEVWSYPSGNVRVTSDVP